MCNEQPYWKNIDFNDYQKLNKLMDNADDFEDVLCGKNDDGETVLTSIFKDKIVVKVLQHNNWICNIVFERDENTIIKSVSYER